MGEILQTFFVSIIITITAYTFYIGNPPKYNGVTVHKLEKNGWIDGEKLLKDNYDKKIYFFSDNSKRSKKFEKNILYNKMVKRYISQFTKIKYYKYGFLGLKKYHSLKLKETPALYIEEKSKKNKIIYPFKDGKMINKDQFLEQILGGKIKIEVKTEK